MKSRKVLLFIFCVVFSVAAFAQNKVINNTLYEIPKTTVAPVIDGIQDPVWLQVDWTFQTSYTNNEVAPGWDGTWTDLFGASKIMYDDNNLYVLIYSQDDDPVGNDAAVVNWQRNGVEIYLDGDNSKDHSVVAPDHHLTFRHEHIGDEANSDWDVETGLDTADIVWKFVDDPTTMTGYWFEMSIPLDAVNMPNTPGSPIGLEIQQNDNDGAGRESVSKWFLQAGDSSYQYASCWGNAIMSSRTVGDAFEINKVQTADAPVIDGDFDAIWTNANSVGTNYFGNISTTAPVYPDNFADAFVRTYLLYDDNNLYGFMHVFDDDPVGNDAASVNWQRNAVEIYFDGDYSRDNSGTVTAPDHHLTFRHEHMGDEANSDWDVETGLDSTDLVWVIKDVPSVVGVADASGYNVEFKIPLDALNMPNTEGSPIGLETQQDDNDGNGRDVVTKWWEALGDSSWQYANSWGPAKLGALVQPVAVNDPSPVVNSYALLQNYPNPFNPTTNIVYSVPQTEKVRLTVYNVLGKQVATLVNEQKSAGTYTVHFNAANLSSGVYIYKLEAGSKMLVNKMMFLK